jgi:hypothetical protein
MMKENWQFCEMSFDKDVGICSWNMRAHWKSVLFKIPASEIELRSSASGDEYTERYLRKPYSSLWASYALDALVSKLIINREFIQLSPKFAIPLAGLSLIHSEQLTIPILSRVDQSNETLVRSLAADANMLRCLSHRENSATRQSVCIKLQGRINLRSPHEFTHPDASEERRRSNSHPRT